MNGEILLKYASFAKKKEPAKWYEVRCKDCGKTIKAHRDWSRPPERCDECRHDLLLIQGAVGALRDQFPFPLETSIEQRGLIFTDKVAVVRNRRTREVVAEVKMDTEGLIFVNKIAVVTDKATGDRLSKTRENQRGILFPRRTADTYSTETGRRKDSRNRDGDGRDVMSTPSG